MPNVPTAKQIHEECEKAIFDFAADGGVTEKFFLGRKWTKGDIDKLVALSERYRQLAIQRGEITATTAGQTVGVSQALICDPSFYGGRG